MIGWVAFPVVGVLAAVAADALRRALRWNASIEFWRASEAWLPTIVPAHAGYTVDPWPALIWLALLFALGLALAAFSMILLAVRKRRGWWFRTLVLWIAVVVVGVVVGGGAQIGEWLLEVQSFGGLGGSHIRTFTVPALQEAARWGLLWGWMPALVSTLCGVPGPNRPSGRRAIIVATVLVIAAALACMFLASTTRGAALSARTEVATQDPPKQTEPAAPTDPPPAVAETIDPDFPGRCAADDVSVEIGGFDAATGSRYLTFEARNMSAEACDLRGAPDLAFASDVGNAIRPVIGPRNFTTAGEPIGEDVVTLAPGGTARADLVWRAPTGRPIDLTVLLAPWAGAVRTSTSEVLDVVDGGEMALTPWYVAE
ncbi:MAG: DUF4232 domain-containing protein [Microbacterium gubbeenense]